MSEVTTTQRWLFSELSTKPLVVEFDEERVSSDAGAVLLKSIDERLRLSERLASCLKDSRQGGKVVHAVGELLRQRVFGIACGYPDANDTARLGDDPVHKLLLGRDPVCGASLASQSTLSRFENSVGKLELYRIAQSLAHSVIERHRKRLRGKARTVTIDLDPTEDPTHGEQQLSFFNGYYGNWCYLPMMAFVSFDREPEQYLLTSVLRPGNSPDKKGAVAIINRLLNRLRPAFKKARFRVRLDAGFAAPDVLDFLDAQPRLEYAVAMPKNKLLLRLSETLMNRARKLANETGQSTHLYSEIAAYRARSWKQPRRIIFKAEVLVCPGHEPKDNPRFVVTNMKQSPKWIYERFYCARGDIENRIKELHHGLDIDRTSCSTFRANQFRVLLTAAAYALFQELRLNARRTSCARAQVQTLRERFIKIGVRVVTSVRRIIFHLPRSYPFLSDWTRLAASLGARPG